MQLSALDRAREPAHTLLHRQQVLKKLVSFESGDQVASARKHVLDKFSYASAALAWGTPRSRRSAMPSPLLIEGRGWSAGYAATWV